MIELMIIVTPEGIAIMGRISMPVCEEEEPLTLEDLQYNFGVVDDETGWLVGEGDYMQDAFECAHDFGRPCTIYGNMEGGPVAISHHW